MEYKVISHKRPLIKVLREISYKKYYNYIRKVFKDIPQRKKRFSKRLRGTNKEPKRIPFFQPIDPKKFLKKHKEYAGYLLQYLNNGFKPQFELYNRPQRKKGVSEVDVSSMEIDTQEKMQIIAALQATQVRLQTEMIDDLNVQELWYLAAFLEIIHLQKQEKQYIPFIIQENSPLGINLHKPIEVVKTEFDQVSLHLIPNGYENNIPRKKFKEIIQEHSSGYFESNRLMLFVSNGQ